jgi:hypothetical protein
MQVVRAAARACTLMMLTLARAHHRLGCKWSTGRWRVRAAVRARSAAPSPAARGYDAGAKSAGRWGERRHSAGSSRVKRAMWRPQLVAPSPNGRARIRRRHAPRAPVPQEVRTPWRPLEESPPLRSSKRVRFLDEPEARHYNELYHEHWGLSIRGGAICSSERSRAAGVT